MFVRTKTWRHQSYAELANAWAESKNAIKAKKAANILRKVIRDFKDAGNIDMRSNIHLHHAAGKICKKL